MENSLITHLNNKELSSVVFVMGYLQLIFQETASDHEPLFEIGEKRSVREPDICISVINEPLLKIAEKQYARDHPEFCGLLVNCIMKTVTSAGLKEGDSAWIVFSNSLEFIIPLKSGDYRYGPEGLMITMADRWDVR